MQKGPIMPYMAFPIIAEGPGFGCLKVIHGQLSHISHILAQDIILLQFFHN